MSESWAACLDVADAGALGRLRLKPELEVCQSGSKVWLKALCVDRDLERALRALPGAERFRILADRQLLPADARVPRGWLPAGPWSKLSDWLQIQLPAAAYAGQVNDRVVLELVRDAVAAEPNLLLTNTRDWSRYTDTAPQVRLDRLAFAVDENGRVLVRGSPLPPIRGTWYVERAGIAVPAGWRWSPPVAPEAVQQALQLQPGDLAVLSRHGSWQQIEADEFVRATRSAVRATLAKMTDAP